MNIIFGLGMPGGWEWIIIGLIVLRALRVLWVFTSPTRAAEPTINGANY